MDELGKVTHDPKVIKALEAKGITSLEQIALSSPALLGLTPSKAKHVIGCAMQNLAEENIEHRTSKFGKRGAEFPLHLEVPCSMLDVRCYLLPFLLSFFPSFFPSSPLCPASVPRRAGALEE
jgi:hypothetical protein